MRWFLSVVLLLVAALPASAVIYSYEPGAALYVTRYVKATGGYIPTDDPNTPVALSTAKASPTDYDWAAAHESETTHYDSGSSINITTIPAGTIIVEELRIKASHLDDPSFEDEVLLAVELIVVDASTRNQTAFQTGDNFAVVSSGTYGNSAIKTALDTKASQASVDDVPTNAEFLAGLKKLGLVESTTIATLASQTSFTLTAGPPDNDAINGHLAIITDQSTPTQKAIGTVLDYVGSTRTVTLAADPGIFTMATGDSIEIIAPSALTAQTIQDVGEEVAEVAGGNFTDPDFDPVPTERRWKLVATADGGLVGEAPKSLHVGPGKKFAWDFSADMAANGRIATVQSVIIDSGPAAGVTFGALGRDRTDGKTRITGVTAGKYFLRMRVTYSDGDTAEGVVELNVKAPGS